MSKTAYPLGSNLESFLVAAGMIDDPPDAQASDLDFDQKVAAASAEWERRTGWIPFAPSGVQTRLFDPPGAEMRTPIYGGYRGGKLRLVFGTGLLSLTSLSLTGQLQTQNTDFYLRPSNAALDGYPYEYVEFVAPRYGAPNSISIVGSWGYAATVPEDAWLAILNGAAAKCSELPGLVSNGVMKWQMRDRSEDYGPDPLGKLMSRWQAEFDKGVRTFMRNPLT